MPKLPRVTARQMATVLEKLESSLTRQSGSHQIYKNAAGNTVAYCTLHVPNVPSGRLEGMRNWCRGRVRLSPSQESDNVSLFGFDAHSRRTTYPGIPLARGCQLRVPVF
jgi:predicted RNA binding protein YcfA (HicA-like mRNA interferase family)